MKHHKQSCFYRPLRQRH